MTALTPQKSTKGAAGLIFTAIYLLSMILLFFGERLVLESNAMRIAVSGIGLLGILVAVLGRVTRRGKIPSLARFVETRILICYLVGVASVLLYFAQADFIMERLRSVFTEAQSAERYQVVLAALWPVIWVCATVPLIFIELSYSTMDISKTMEPGRIRRSAQSGLFLAITLCLIFVVNYISSEFNKKVDLSYFKTTAASESSQKMVQNLSEPLQVFLFFPLANEVYELVHAFFEDLKKESKYLELKSVDHVMEPALAKEHSVNGNGVVLLLRGQKREQINIGVKLEQAKGKLRKLDSEFQAAFMKLSGTPKVAYFTVGHEERTQKDRDQIPGTSIDGIKQILKHLNYQVKELGLGQGLGSEVPADATLVIIPGPRKEFLDAEIGSLKKYLLGGGRMMVFLDSESEQDLAGLLGPFGLKYSPVPLANDRFHVKLTHTLADRNFLFSNRFSAHPSITTLSRNSTQVATVMLGAGALEERPSTDGYKTQVQFTLHSMPYTWNDLNNNREFNAPEEKQKIYELGAVVTMKVDKPVSAAPVTPPKDTPDPPGEAQKTATAKGTKEINALDGKKDAKGTKEINALDGKKDAKEQKKQDPDQKVTPTDQEMRLIVLADSDLISDRFFRNPGNGYFFIDSLKWIGGEEKFMGQTTSEEDIKIIHTQKEDQIWFYLTIFGIPSLVLALGLWMNHRRRRKS